MNCGHINRRELLAAVGAGAAVSWVGLSPSMARAAVRPDEVGEITDMTMNSPSYSAQVGYGRTDHKHDGIDPLALAFGI